MEKKRSRGVTIFSVIVIIWSIPFLFPLVASFLLFARGLRPIPVPSSGYTQSIILGFCWLIAAIGCLRLNYYWGRLLMLFLSIFALCRDILLGLFTFKQGMDSIVRMYPMISKQLILTGGIIILSLEAIFLISLLVFFTRPKVKEQFR